MAAVTTLPRGAISTGITNNWTRVRPSFFRGLARHLEYAEDKIFGLILDSTVGHARTWDKIGWKRFLEVVAVTRRRCEQAISSLLDDGLIRVRRATVGNGNEYAIAARADGEKTGIAKCRGCGETAEVDLDADFIPVPHSFFVTLPAFCDHGMYLIVKTVVEKTMRWDRESKQIVVVPCEITIEEFERATGKKRSEILGDLAKAQAAGCEFIGSERVGRGNHYWARPENFAAGVRRPLRKVEQPKREKKAKILENGPQAVEAPAETKVAISPVEFVTLPCGVCRKCGCYGPMDVVDAEKQAPKKPLGAVARAGPPQTGHKRTKNEEMIERLKAKYA